MVEKLGFRFKVIRLVVRYEEEGAEWSGNASNGTFNDTHGGLRASWCHLFSVKANQYRE